MLSDLCEAVETFCQLGGGGEIETWQTRRGGSGPLGQFLQAETGNWKPGIK